MIQVLGCAILRSLVLDEADQGSSIRDDVGGGFLRWSFGRIRVFPLAAPLPEALGWDVVLHLTVVADLVGLRHVFKALLIAGSQTLVDINQIVLHGVVVHISLTTTYQ